VRQEVFRGADSFKLCPHLGGRINLVPLTGNTAAPFQVRIEGGSMASFFFRGDHERRRVEDNFDE